MAFISLSLKLGVKFLIGVIVMIGAFVGPYIRKLTPRAAMLGTLAGISITFISMRPAAQMWEVAWIGLPVLAIILIGFFTDVKLPGNIPIGLVALLVGTAIGWAGGYMSAPDVGQAVSDIAVGVPDLRLDMLISGLSDLAPLLGTAIPLGVYNFTEAMSNVESAAAAGDDYNLRSVLLADGAARRGLLVLGHDLLHHADEVLGELGAAAAERGQAVAHLAPEELHRRHALHIVAPGQEVALVDVDGYVWVPDVPSVA